MVQRGTFFCSLLFYFIIAIVKNFIFYAEEYASQVLL